jgi:hypothetical protein
MSPRPSQCSVPGFATDTNVPLQCMATALCNSLHRRPRVAGQVPHNNLTQHNGLQTWYPVSAQSPCSTLVLVCKQQTRLLVSRRFFCSVLQSSCQQLKHLLLHVWCRYKAEKLQLDGRLSWNTGSQAQLPELDSDGEALMLHVYFTGPEGVVTHVRLHTCARCQHSIP